MSRFVSTLKVLLFYMVAYAACLLLAGMIAYTWGWPQLVGDTLAWCFYAAFIYTRP